jgi:hypothetical protein
MNGIVKRGIWGFIMCLIYSLPSFAQHRSEHYQQIESIKVAFITSKLDLTTEEAQKFWPVYNSYQKEMANLMRKRREARFKPNIDPNDKINADLDYETRMLELKKKYKKLYAKAIPPEKILLLYQAEREFREHLIKQLKHRRKVD